MKTISIIILLCSTIYSSAYSSTEAEIVAATIILEAGGEYSPYALEAVNEVIHNRATKRRITPSEVCLQRLQFSCWNNVSKRSELMAKAKAHPRYSKALDIATSSVTDYTNGADHYHADYCDPYWSKHMKITVKIGRHIFYK